MFGHHHHHHHHHHHDADHVDFGTLGGRAFFQYWSDLTSVSMCVMQDQMTAWVALWQGAATGALDPRSFVKDVAGIWAATLQSVAGLMAFPFEWSVRRLMSTPSIVFMVDGWSQTAGPQGAPTAISMPPGTVVASTNLQMINDPTKYIPARNVRVRLRSRGNRVEVSLVDLADVGPTPQPPAIVATVPGNNLAAGFYVGVAYAVEGPNRRPLALVYVNVDRSIAPP